MRSCFVGVNMKLVKQMADHPKENPTQFPLYLETHIDIFKRPDMKEWLDDRKIYFWGGNIIEFKTPEDRTAFILVFA